MQISKISKQYHLYIYRFHLCPYCLQIDLSPDLA